MNNLSCVNSLSMHANGMKSIPNLSLSCPSLHVFPQPLQQGGIWATFPINMLQVQCINLMSIRVRMWEQGGILLFIV